MSRAILLWDVKHITTGVFLIPVSDDVLGRKTKTQGFGNLGQGRRIYELLIRIWPASVNERRVTNSGSSKLRLPTLHIIQRKCQIRGSFQRIRFISHRFCQLREVQIPHLWPTVLVAIQRQIKVDSLRVSLS